MSVDNYGIWIESVECYLMKSSVIKVHVYPNALVISNHGPHPRERVGDSRGNVQGFDQSFAMAVRGKYLECFISAMK